MKINIIILTLFFFFFSKLNAGQIFIVVKNIEEKVGSIHFALYDDADFFPDNEGKKIGFAARTNEKQIGKKIKIAPFYFLSLLWYYHIHMCSFFVICHHLFRVLC